MNKQINFDMELGLWLDIDDSKITEQEVSLFQNDIWETMPVSDLDIDEDLEV